MTKIGHNPATPELRQQLRQKTPKKRVFNDAFCPKAMPYITSDTPQSFSFNVFKSSETTWGQFILALYRLKRIFLR